MAIGRKTGGRRPGSPNRFTRSVREVLSETFTNLQGEPDVNLFDWAKNNPTEFYKLAAKLIPTKIESETTPQTQTIIQIVPDPLSAPITD
jgi:hypothetical protein